MIGQTMERNKAYIVGLTGGIASGKSHVARALADAAGRAGVKARVIDSDALAAEAWGDEKCRQKLTALLGAFVAPPLPCQVDRKAVAAAIFADDSLRRGVEAIIHPYVARQRAALIRQAEVGVEVGLFVLDSPLLLESGLAAGCDAVLFVDTPDEVRRHRAGVRGWSADALARREDAQWTLGRKKSAANHVISGAYDDVRLAMACDDFLRAAGVSGAK